MTIYNRLVKLKKKLGKTALRSPRTNQELITRKNYDRVTTILMKRYEYNIDDLVMDEYRRQDQIEEITAIKRF